MGPFLDAVVVTEIDGIEHGARSPANVPFLKPRVGTAA